jgi:glycosyltransferase involved in cell wall biosynthesis
MKIIHLLSNWKWTERSELVIDLALSQSRLGETVWLVCGPAPPENGPAADVSFYARQKGLDNIIVLPEMTKHLRLFRLFQGGKKIREIIDRVDPDVIHCHMRNAHLLAALGCGKNSTAPLVRSVYNPDGLGRDFRSRWCYRNFTRGIIVVTEKAKQSALAQSFPAERVKVIQPGIDLERFSPERKLSGGKDFGFLDGCFVAGVVSRIRQARRIDIPLHVLHRLHESYPRLRLLLVGRGRAGAVEKVVEKPAADLGVQNKIIQAGYCGGDDLAAAYHHMQVLLYPMPGTDKTCRTVREALAAGVPVIAADMGFLPELIRDSQNGYLVDQSPEGFAPALKKLMDSPDTVQKLSCQALSSARERFDWQHLGEESLRFYNSVRSGVADTREGT